MWVRKQTTGLILPPPKATFYTLIKHGCRFIGWAHLHLHIIRLATITCNFFILTWNGCYLSYLAIITTSQKVIFICHRFILYIFCFVCSSITFYLLWKLIMYIVSNLCFDIMWHFIGHTLQSHGQFIIYFVIYKSFVGLCKRVCDG